MAPELQKHAHVIRNGMLYGTAYDMENGMTFKRYGNHPQPVPREPEPIQPGNGHRIVQASSADIDRWRRDPATPMYSPQVAASAPAPQTVAAAAPTTTADDFRYFMHLLGGPFRQYGTPPPSGAFDVPAVAGSASDIQHSHEGCAAQEGPWR